MDACHLKHAELAKHLQKYQSRVVLRGGNVKDDTCGHTVLTEQGASASLFDSRQSTGYCFLVARYVR